MYNNTMKNRAMNRANEARRKAEAKELAILLIQRSQSNANGEHANPATKRLKTRANQIRKAIRDFD